MDGVAAEVSEEVFVLFEHGDVVAVAGEEIGEHHASGASAYDAAGGLERWRGGGHRWDEGSKGLMGGQKACGHGLQIRQEQKHVFWRGHSMGREADFSAALLTMGL